MRDYKLPERLDFRNKYLSRRVFNGVDLRGANFKGSDMRAVIFKDCDLRHSVFKNTNLRSAIFKNCNLQRSVFIKSSLVDTVFDRCDTKWDYRYKVDERRVTDQPFFNRSVKETGIRTVDEVNKGVSTLVLNIRLSKDTPVDIIAELEHLLGTGVYRGGYDHEYGIMNIGGICMELKSLLYRYLNGEYDLLIAMQCNFFGVFLENLLRKLKPHIIYNYNNFKSVSDLIHDFGSHKGLKNTSINLRELSNTSIDDKWMNRQAQGYNTLFSPIGELLGVIVSNGGTCAIHHRDVEGYHGGIIQIEYRG